MSESVIREPERALPVVASYDVAVVGGGIAGASAAVAAARQGRSVCLIERAFGIGGLATLGNVIVFLPLCDGLGRQVSAGLAEEMLKLSIASETAPLPSMRVDADIPPCWRGPATREQRRNARYRVCFNPTRFMMDLEQWLLDNGVDIMYDTRFCTVVKDDAAVIRALVVENKDGRCAIRCGMVVDASGDADVCRAAGEAVISLDTNVRCGWYYYVENGHIKIDCLSKPYRQDGGRHPDAGRHYSGDVAADVTAHVIDTRRLIRQALEDRRRAGEGPVYPVLVPTTACFRMSRRLCGSVELTGADQGRWFEDTIAMVGDWRRPGPAYCIPFRTLTAVRTPNLVASGRCMSAGGSAWDATRAIPVCAATGEAAGTAAALAVSAGMTAVAGLNIEELQTCLRRQGVILDATLLDG